MHAVVFRFYSSLQSSRTACVPQPGEDCSTVFAEYAVGSSIAYERFWSGRISMQVYYPSHQDFPNRSIGAGVAQVDVASAGESLELQGRSAQYRDEYLRVLTRWPAEHGTLT